jgi:thiol-disulfide isomerase/thioredoxin
MYLLYTMSAFLNLIFVRLRPLLIKLIPVIFIAVILGVVYYAYNKIYVPKKQNKKFQDVANANPTGRTITVMMFHVDWCPHCKRALPEWNMFSTEYNGKQVNGYKIECIEYDSTNADDPKIKRLLDEYKIKQYPTVIASVPSADGKDLRVDFEAKVSKKNLETFVVSVATENHNI